MIVKEARETINRLIQDIWSPKPIVWDNVTGRPASDQVPWIRVQILHSRGGPETLANSEGKVRYSREGIVSIQLFVPAGTGLGQNDELIQLFLNQFERPNIKKIWFRNTSFREIGADGAWFQTNFTSQFSYTEVK